MKTYFFVLGTNHTLSKIDIVNVLGRMKANFEIIEASEEVLLVTTKESLDENLLMGELGSAAKMGQIFNLYSKEDFPENLFKEVDESSFKSFFLPQGEKEIRFGVSVYNGGGGFKSLNQTWFFAPKIAREIKETLGINHLPVKERELSSVVVNQTGLLKNGFELVLIAGTQGIYVGKTIAIQDYESYSLRDYGRPARDTFSGMIPPKLAKMMINLAGKEKIDLFLDPFCGSGTFLQELILLGYKNMVGTDSSEKSVADSTTNLNWLFEKYPLKKADFQIKLVMADVRKLSSQISFKIASAIVTEPYLGSPKARYFNEEEISKEVRKLEELYLAAFDEFRKVLKDGGVIVIIFPIFRFNNKFFSLEILEQIKKLGFQKKDYLLEKPKGEELLRLNLSSRNSVIFFRPGQTISREIFVFSL